MPQSFEAGGAAVRGAVVLGFALPARGQGLKPRFALLWPGGDVDDFRQRVAQAYGEATRIEIEVDEPPAPSTSVRPARALPRHGPRGRDDVGFIGRARPRHGAWWPAPA